MWASLLRRLGLALRLRGRTGLASRTWLGWCRRTGGLGLRGCSCRRWLASSRSLLACGCLRRLSGRGWLWGFRSCFRWCADSLAEAHLTLLMFSRLRYGEGAETWARQGDCDACQRPETGAFADDAVQWSAFCKERSRAGRCLPVGDAPNLPPHPVHCHTARAETRVSGLSPRTCLFYSRRCTFRPVSLPECV